MKYPRPYIFLLLLPFLLLAACKGSQNGSRGDESAETVSDPPAPEVADDRIVFHTGVCFGACPDYAISLDASGRVELWGGIFARFSGYYLAQAPAEDMKLFREYVDSPDWDTLRNEYRARWTDDRAVALSLVKNGRIVHSLYDYGAQAGGVAGKCYQFMERLYRSLEFQPMSPGLLTCWQFQDRPFKVNGQTYPLTRSEYFFLWQEWRDARDIKTTIDGPFEEAEEPYYVHGKNRMMNQAPVARQPNCLGNTPKANPQVSTDGRTFSIDYEDGNQTNITLDYPFFEENVFARVSLK